MRRQVLVVDADIDVADTDDVADVLRGAVVVFFKHGDFPCLLDIKREIRRTQLP